MNRLYSFFILFLMLCGSSLQGAASSSSVTGVDRRKVPSFCGVKSLEKLAQDVVLKEFDRDSYSPMIQSILKMSSRQAKLPLMRAVINRGVVKSLGKWMLQSKLGVDASGIAFSPTGERLATMNDEGVHLWDMKTGGLLHSWPRPNVSRYRGMISFNPTEETVAAAWQNESQIHVFDLDDAGERHHIPLEAGSDLKSIQYSPCGTSLLCLPLNRRHVWFIDPSGRAERRACTGYIGLINSAQFSPDGSRVVLAGANGLIYINDVSTGQVLTTLEGHAGGTLFAKFCSDGTSVISLGTDNIYLWDVHTRARMKSIEQIKTGYAKTMDIDSGNLVTFCGALQTAKAGRAINTSSLILHDIDTNNCQAVVPIAVDSSKDELRQLLFNPDGSLLAVIKPIPAPVELWSDYMHTLVDLNETELEWLFGCATYVWGKNKILSVVSPHDVSMRKKLATKCMLFMDDRFKNLFEQ